MKKSESDYIIITLFCDLRQNLCENVWRNGKFDYYRAFYLSMLKSVKFSLFG